MSKFIEVKEGIRGETNTITLLINADHIKKVLPNRSFTEIHMVNKEELYVQQTYDEVKAMIMYDPAVADIVRKGNEYD